MICDPQNALRARTGLTAFAILALTGSASGQIDTRDWLLPQSGLWSDAANWSDANVPDSASEIARLSPMPLVGLGGGTPRATVDGLYEVLRLQGNGAVEVFIDEGSELFVSDGVIEGIDGGILAITLGSSLGDHALASLLTLGNGAGRQTAVRNTAISMVGEGDNTSIINGDFNLLSSSRLEGQGTIESITNYGEVVVVKKGNGSGELRITNGLTNRGTLTVEPTGHLVLDDCSLGQREEIDNRGLITFLDSTFSGTINGNTDWIGSCALTNSEFLGGNSHVDGTLGITQISGILAGNLFSLHNGSEMNFNDTVFLQGKATFSEPRREIIFEPSDKAPRVSAPEGETIVAMPGFEITGAGIIDANFLNFGSLKTNRGTTFDAVEEIIEVRGEFTQTSSALLEISIDPNLGSPVADSIVITGGDADLDGELMISVRLDFNNPFSQIGVANKSFTLVRLDDPTGQHAITGEFSSVTAQVLDDRLGRNPIITYHDDRVEATFYCRADINRNGTIEPADFTAWISAYQQGYPLADVTNNGILNANDFTKWVELYNLGCSD